MDTVRVGLWDGWVDLEAREVHREERCRLTPMEWRLLTHLVQRPERLCSWEELRREVWGYSPRTTTRTYTATAHRLRRKIEANPSRPRHIHTVYGGGLRFVPLPTVAGRDIESLAAENRRLRALVGAPGG